MIFMISFRHDPLPTGDQLLSYILKLDISASHQEAFSDDRSNHRTDDGTGREIGEPVDRYRNADPDIESIKDRRISDPSIFRI